MTGAYAIELDLVCLPRTTSDKRDERTKLQEVPVVKERIVRILTNRTYDTTTTRLLFRHKIRKK